LVGTIGLWLPLRALFRRAGIGGSLAELSRSADRADVEEAQLANVVEEMAIAAGLPTPDVRLADTPTPTAAITGSSSRSFSIVLARPILDRLDRSETQGLAATLVASASNGDIELALAMRSVFHALGLITATFDLPYSKTARLAWWAFVKLCFSPSAQKEAKRTDEVSRLLLQNLDPAALEDIVGESSEPTGCTSCPGFVFRNLVLFPWLMGRLFAALALLLAKLLIIGPLLGVIWRRRRLLADATAVRLTREPTAIAAGLLRFRGEIAQSAEVPEGVDPWAQLLMAVGPASIDNKLTNEIGIVATFVPSLNSRLRLLIAQGARVEYTPYREPNTALYCFGCLLVVGVIVAVAYRLSTG
jgi:Zn-dependent protease with chaperone function